MREQLAIVVNENENGEVRAQLMEDVQKAMESFTNLHGRVADPPSRVTLVTLDYAKGVEVRVKNLPVQDPPKDEQPDGFVLGKGPIWLEKEEEGDGTESKDRGDGGDE